MQLVEFGNALGGELESYTMISRCTSTEVTAAARLIVWRPVDFAGKLRHAAKLVGLLVHLFILSPAVCYLWLVVMVDSLIERCLEASTNKHIKLVSFTRCTVWHWSQNGVKVAPYWDDSEHGCGVCRSEGVSESAVKSFFAAQILGEAAP